MSADPVLVRSESQAAEQADLIFRRGSRTFYYSSRFFPGRVRGEVADLYAFVRVVDDMVDQIVPDRGGYNEFVAEYRVGLAGGPVHNDIIARFIRLQRKCGFEQAWVDAFLASMEMDLHQRVYTNLDETIEYMYGSAEVIGLMMARLMRLPDSSLEYAARLGRAFQYMNMLRDIADDIQLGRCYIPQEIRDEFGLQNLDYATAYHHPEAFRAMMRHEIQRFRTWLAEAEQGFHFIPWRYRIPIATAADMFSLTMDTIANDPFVVYQRKVKPSTMEIIMCAIQHAVVDPVVGAWPIRYFVRQ